MIIVKGATPKPDRTPGKTTALVPQEIGVGREEVSVGPASPA